MSYTTGDDLAQDVDKWLKRQLNAGLRPDAPGWDWSVQTLSQLTSSDVRGQDTQVNTDELTQKVKEKYIELVNGTGYRAWPAESVKISYLEQARHSFQERLSTPLDYLKQSVSQRARARIAHGTQLGEISQLEAVHALAN